MSVKMSKEVLSIVSSLFPNMTVLEFINLVNSQQINLKALESK